MDFQSNYLSAMASFLLFSDIPPIPCTGQVTSYLTSLPPILSPLVFSLRYSINFEALDNKCIHARNVVYFNIYFTSGNEVAYSAYCHINQFEQILTGLIPVMIPTYPMK